MRYSLSLFRGRARCGSGMRFLPPPLSLSFSLSVTLSTWQASERAAGIPALSLTRGNERQRKKQRALRRPESLLLSRSALPASRRSSSSSSSSQRCILYDYLGFSESQPASLLSLFFFSYIHIYTHIRVYIYVYREVHILLQYSPECVVVVAVVVRPV